MCQHIHPLSIYEFIFFLRTLEYPRNNVENARSNVARGIILYKTRTILIGSSSEGQIQR